jgi:tRNA pseudouridine38/39 synthase
MGKEYDWSKVEFGQFLIKFSYVGTRYCGVAYQDDEILTVEREIFRALEKTKMIRNRNECNFSRCGRTDAGVHAAGNYMCISLRVKPVIDHLKVINKVLPNDIRFLGMRKVDEKFSARFDCKGRIYKYYQPIWTGLDIDKIVHASRQLIGEHDFRNFCKMDITATTNYVRKIHAIEFRVDREKSMLEIEIRGNAFLWHQVRCIVAILLMIGEGIEEEHLIDELLDIEKNPRKPLYRMADPSGLVLYDCLFDESQLGSDGCIKINETHEHLMSHREDLAETLRRACVLQAINGLSSTHAGTIQRWTQENHHTCLLKRAKCPSLEEKVDAHEAKKRKRDGSQVTPVSTGDDVE